jgi:hypothetical protein
MRAGQVANIAAAPWRRGILAVLSIFAEWAGCRRGFLVHCRTAPQDVSARISWFGPTLDKRTSIKCGR